MPDEQYVRESVLAASDENSALLVKLARTSEAPSILSAHVAHVSYLEETLEEQETTLRQVIETADMKYKMHKKYQDSTARKLYYKATRMLSKFESRATMSEHQYFTALGSKSKAEERCQILKRDLDEATKTQEALEKMAKEHDDTHHRIDKLYEKIFAGPTPGFPKEDEREIHFYTARGTNEDVKADIIKARRATRLLNIAANNLKRAGNFVRQARSEAENSIFFYGEALSSLGITNEYCGYGLSNVGRAEDLLKPLDPEMEERKRQIVTALQGARVENRSGLSGERVFAAVGAMQIAIESAQEKLKEMIEATKRKEKNGLETIKKTARMLEDSRQALQEIRQGIFEEVAGFGEAAPSYMECCDRAHGFCELPAYPQDEGDGPSEGENEERQPQQNEAGESSAVTATHGQEEAPVIRKIFTSKDLGLLA